MKTFGLRLLCAHLRPAVDASTVLPSVPLSYLRQLNPASPSPTPRGGTVAF